LSGPLGGAPDGLSGQPLLPGVGGLCPDLTAVGGVLVAHQLVALQLVGLASVEGDVDGAIGAPGDAGDGAPLGTGRVAGPGQDALPLGPDTVRLDAGAGGCGVLVAWDGVGHSESPRGVHPPISSIITPQRSRYTGDRSDQQQCQQRGGGCQGHGAVPEERPHEEGSTAGAKCASTTLRTKRRCF